MDNASDPSDVLKIACPHCDRRILLEGIPAFTPTECPDCGYSFPVPKRFGSFFLEEPLGSTTVATTYRALDIKLEREIAVKILQPRATQSESTVASFKSCAQTSSLLNHANIIFTYNSDTEDEKPYLVMEYMENGSLHHLMNTRNEPLSIVETLRISRGIASALKYTYNTHNKSHDNLKPKNVLFGIERAVKISDFTFCHTSFNRTDSAETSARHIRLHAGFSSPELLTKGSQDFRGDFFSLGALMHYMLTGEQPFSSNRSKDVFSEDTPSLDLKTIRNDIPGDLHAFVQQMMAFSPSNRPANHDDLLDRINHFLRETDSTNTPAVTEATRTKPKTSSAIKEASKLSGELPDNEEPDDEPSGAAKRVLKSRGNQRSRSKIEERNRQLRRKKKQKRTLDCCNLILLLILGCLLAYSVRTEAPWYSVLTSKSQSGKSDQSQSDSSGEGSNKNNGVSKTDHTDLPDQPPVYMGKRPKAPGLRFDKIKQKTDAYVELQPSKALKKLESSRIDLLETIRAHIVEMSRNMPYSDIERGIRMADGRHLKARVAFTNEHSLEIRKKGSEEDIHEITWEAIAPVQMAVFLDHYGNKRAEYDEKKDAAYEYFLAALLMDWYGEDEQARKLGLKAKNTHPSYKKKVKLYLYYLFDKNSLSTEQPADPSLSESRLF